VDKLTTIRGINEMQAQRLHAEGIRTLELLLSVGRFYKDAHALAQRTGINEQELRRWLDHADLRRLKGIGPEFAELLLDSGVKSVHALARRNPQRLLDSLRAQNAAKGLVRRMPTLPQVTDWIEQAKALPTLMDYGGGGGGGRRWSAEAPIPPSPKAEPELRPRYANAVLVEETADTPMSQHVPLKPGQVSRLRLDIGELSLESAVVEPVPIPEHLLPKEDLWLDVMVSSTHFDVGQTPADLGQSRTAHGRFFLPKGGGPAKTPDGKKYLYFLMCAPTKSQTARARIGYYYRNHLVQSQLLVADVGGTEGGYHVEVDYTLSQSLTSLEELPSRRQVSIVTNDNGNGKHQIIVRAGDSTGAELGKFTYELDERTVGKLVADLRTALKSDAPTVKKRRKEQLRHDLEKLAPLGWDLWNAVVPEEYMLDLYSVLDPSQNPVIQVSRPTISSYTFPWGLMYDIPIKRDKPMSLCPLVKEWDEKHDLVGPGVRQCPKAPNGRHAENTICPFGFWGYRYPIEQLSSTDRSVLTIAVPPEFEIVVAETQYEVDLKDLDAHIQQLKKTLQAHFAHATMAEGKDYAKIQSLLGRDLPLVYFYCHGERLTPGDQNTYLGVGKREQLTPKDFKGWVLNWFRHENKRVWDKVRPLIFINACHSLEINPDTLTTYLEAFVGAGHAAGVIGTEVKVSQALAMDVAISFFEWLFQGASVDQALHTVRLDYLKCGNLFGLVYTSYCWADLKLAVQ